MSFRSERHLFEAIDQCRWKKLVSLVQIGRNIRCLNEFGQNFLVYLIQQQSQDTDELTKKKRRKIFQNLIKDFNLDVHRIDSFGKNLFNWTTNLNCTDEAIYLLRLFPGDLDLLRRDHSGSCSLHYAVEHGNELLVHLIVHYLLRYRLRFDIKDGLDHTPEDLAMKLGYEHIGQFLARTSKSTNYMSREIPSARVQLFTTTNEKPKHFSSITDSYEYFPLIEQRIEKAKRLGDWKAVIALRAFKRPNRMKKTYEILPSIHRKPSAMRSSLKPSSTLTNMSMISQSEQMLHLCEEQLSSSFRPSFVPCYPRIVNFANGSPIHIIGQRKLSQTSSRRISSVSSGHRKRDSELSQISLSAIQDLQTRYSLPVIHKQQRSSIVTAH